MLTQCPALVHLNLGENYLRSCIPQNTADRFGSSSDPSLNGNLHYPNNIDRSLNEATDDKIRKYRADYNNNPPNTVSFMTAICM